jgi:hypothetical protein
LQSLQRGVPVTSNVISIGEDIMFRKILFITSFVMLVSLFAAGIALKTPVRAGATTVASTTAPVVTPQAAQCNAPIGNIKFDILRRLPGGGHEVRASWSAPNLASCISVTQYHVKATLNFPKVTRDHEEVVPGTSTSAKFVVRGFLTDTTPNTFSVKITADLKTNAAARGAASGQASINP